MKSKPTQRKVYLRSFGCQMNVRDSEVIAGLLTRQGYELTSRQSEADIVIYNTCSVRQHAEDKVWSELGRYDRRKRFKGQSPSGTVPIIGLAGCMAQNYKDEVFRRAPQVDFAVGPSDIHRIPKIITKLSAMRSTLYANKIWETDGNIRPEEIYHTGFYGDKNHAFVVISEGCSNLCSYCIVPYVRGALKNRHHLDIIDEIERAVDSGIVNITLLGQNVSAYGVGTSNQSIETRENINFVKLLELVNQIEGLNQISFITSHPKDTTVDLFKAMRDLSNIKKYLHLPVQSGSDRILQLMNRGYARRFYLDLVQAYRKIVKGAVLTTDIIVGFPSENEEDFQDTYNLVKEVEFDSAYIFKYSPRPHTQAENQLDNLPRQEKEGRHQLVLNLQKEISKRKRTDA